MWLPVANIAQAGIITDIQSHLLPPGAWSGGKNIRFRHGKAFRTLGNKQTYTTKTDALWGLNIDSGVSSYWIVSESDEIGFLSQNSYTRLTSVVHRGRSPVTYTPDVDEDQLWNGGNLSGVLVLNNGNDRPFSWTPGQASVYDLHDPADTDDSWPETLRTKVIRPFKNFLIAGNLTTGNTRNYNRIRWSNAAAPGELPSSWKLDSAAIDAGQTDLADDTAGEIVDLVQLGDQMLIYKNNSVHSMQYVGGNNIFNFRQIFTHIGALETDCVASFSHRGGLFHCVFTGDDILIHDGRSVTSTLYDRVSKYVSDSLHEDHWKRSFVINFPEVKENWICYPRDDAETPHHAVVWNYETDSVTFIDLDEDLRWIGRGIIEDAETDPSWTGDSASWDSDDEPWDVATVGQRNLRSVQFIKGRGLFEMDSDSSPETFDSELKRENFAYVPDRRTLEPIFDPGREKIVKGLRLHFANEESFNKVDIELNLKQELYGSTEGVKVTLNEKREQPHWDVTPKKCRALDITIRNKPGEERHKWELLGMEIDILPVQSGYGGRPGTREARGISPAPGDPLL